jgi:F420-dependent oxidoreductase-like protein
MRIGLPGGGANVDRIVGQAQRAEADGFTSLWYAGGAGGDPTVALALAGRATERIELGTSVLQTYPTHPLAMAWRAASIAAALERPGFTLGIGPSHRPVIEDALGLSYARPGRHTEEYVQILAPLLRGEDVAFDGEDFHVRLGGYNNAPPEHPIPLLIAALAPRLLRVAGTHADGTITWMANAKAVAELIAPRITAAAEAAGRPTPRIVVGLPFAVVDADQEDAAREAAARQFAGYGLLPNYQRVLAAGGLTQPADAAIVGDEESVAAQVGDLFAAGATDVWAAPFPVGDDRAASRARTRALLKTLANAPTVR